MEKIKSIEEALNLFIDSTTKHAECTVKGENHKITNMYYDKIISSLHFLRKVNALEMLFKLLNHPSIGVRLWSATYLLNSHEVEALNVLKEIAKTHDILSFDAKITLNEWEKGSLKLYFGSVG